MHHLASYTAAPGHHDYLLFATSLMAERDRFIFPALLAKLSKVDSKGF
jgi:hypothetical protein